MRIVSGQYRGRHFDIPRTFKARPTTDFAKENIFNVVRGHLSLDGAVALDLFAGTGSISLELISRGCSKVVSVEADRDHAAFIRQCMEKLGTDRSVLVRGDVFRYLKSCREQFDFVFADPPYQLPTLAQVPDQVLHGNLLKPGGLFVFEHGKQHSFDTHPCFLDHRVYGSVNFTLFSPA